MQHAAVVRKVVADEARAGLDEARPLHAFLHLQVLRKAHVARVVRVRGAERAVQADGGKPPFGREMRPRFLAPKARVVRVQERAALLLDAVKEAARAAMHRGVGGDAERIRPEALEGRDLVEDDVVPERFAGVGMRVFLEERPRMRAAVQVQGP